MKKYSRTIRRLREKDNKIVKFKDDMDALVSSEEFITQFRGYVEDIARFRKVNGRKFLRSTEYASIGILDMNDVYQEAYLAFLEAYNNLNWGKISEVHENERGAVIWSFLKKSTALNLNKSLRQKKDGVRVPERIMFETDNANLELVTSLFGHLERVFSNNAQEVAMTPWEQELTGLFLESHMDDVLDLKKNGTRNLKGIERHTIKAFFGIDQPRQTLRELGKYYGINESTVRVLKIQLLLPYFYLPPAS